MRTARLLASCALLGALVAVPSTGAAAGHEPALHCSPVGTAGIPGAGGSHVDVLDSLAQVLPVQRQHGGSRAYLCQARNAFESFQIEVTAGKKALVGVRMSTSALDGPDGAQIPARDVRLSREGYVRLRKASDAELAGVVHRDAHGKCLGDCRFPDPLIPDVNPLTRKNGGAFPLTVPRGENRAVWVDVQVPTGQHAGTYHGSVTITRSAGAVATVPVRLQVLPTTLPSTSSIGGAFFVTLGNRVAPNNWTKVYREFAELGLDNRITVIPDNTIPPQHFAAAFSRLLAGTDPRVLLPGARLTAFPMASSWSAGDIAAYYQKLKAVNAGRRASFYCDEIPSPDCASAYNARTANAHNLPLSPIDYPGRPNWTVPDPGDPDTTVPDEITAAGPVSALIVYVDALQSKASGNRVPGFGAWQTNAAHRQIWAYTACPSGGCSNSNTYHACCRGTVSYGIDQTASEQRAMGWQLFVNHLQGELYYSVDGQLDVSADPMRSGVNGDGTLFYSSTGGTIDGTHSTPLESIRLKRIRDGRQDYELLRRAAGMSAAKAQRADDIARTLFPKFYKSAVSAPTFDAARTKLVALLR